MTEVKYRVKSVHKIPQSLNSSKASDPDSIPMLRKKCASELATISTSLFQISHNKGIFPENWKS